MREIFFIERTVHMIDDIELLRLIENNARLSSEEIAVMLGTTAADVEAEIKRLKDENIILGYNTIINWEKQAPDNCIGMIEVRITPVKNKGYDHIAQILSKYDKVTACYLMSGGFDLMIIYEDSNLRSPSGHTWLCVKAWSITSSRIM